MSVNPNLELAKSERTLKKEKNTQAEGKNLFENNCSKKTSTRHSYHPGNSPHYMQNTSFEFQNFAHQVNAGMELQRQRSFVSPGQLQQQRDNHHQRKRSGAVQAQNQRPGKPAMEIYRPPTRRDPYAVESIGKMTNGFYELTSSQSNGSFNYPNKPGLNIHAKEFMGVPQHQKAGTKLQHSKSGQNLRGISNGTDPSPHRVHFSDNKENLPDAKNDVCCLALTSYTAVGSPVKRSKSLGSADLRSALIGERSPISDIGPFAQEVHHTISKAFNDPNTLNARQLMEVVRHVFVRVVEASRYAEPTARLCIAIIEKEKGETFLETLLNTCQEYFHERDRMLRSSTPAPYPGYVASHPRWIAYMSFLNEMYTQLKRRHVQLMTRRMQNSETAPGLLLLTLLAQCCHVCLREQAVNSLAETECLFFVLTAVGKDIEVEIPHQMGRVMGAARDAFLITVHVPAVRKTLLQLIEMHAARWQLPASAVMYYYPGSGGK